MLLANLTSGRPTWGGSLQKNSKNVGKILSNSLNLTDSVSGQNPHLLVNAVAHGSAPATAPPQNAPKVSVDLSSAAPSYAAVVNSCTSQNCMKLAFIPPDVVNGLSVVKYKAIDVIRGVNRWKSAAFG
ncbi:hypothetical protein LIER_06330 [Lithospermum erythrorhizon]|uniref:Uncharacterized protein n=1 Tax=Lithospermum erythrorhizon TaxID=34254 RepID=A0AAV3P5P3_LITER